MGPYRNLERIGDVAYKLELPQELADFHDVFHISVLRKVVREPKLVIPVTSGDLGRDWSEQYKPVSILA